MQHGSFSSSIKLNPFKSKAQWAKVGTIGSAKPPKPAAAAPAPAPAPWDSQYAGTVASLTQNRDTSLANVAANRATLQSTYGYNLDGSENTSDPYSRLAQLRADYEKVKRGSGVNYAASGQFYSGAYQNQVNSDQEGQNRSLDALRKDFNDQAANLRNQETSIYNEYNSGLTSASNQRIQSAADAVANGDSPVATASPRMQAVLSALAGKLSPSHRRKLRNEALKNGWITA